MIGNGCGPESWQDFCGVSSATVANISHQRHITEHAVGKGCAVTTPPPPDKQYPPDTIIDTP